MGDNDPTKITVTTQFNEEMIRQFTDMANHRMFEGVIRLREQGIREALVKLGWTPPDGDAFLEGVKAGLEAAAQHAKKVQHGTYSVAATSLLNAIRAIDPATVKEPSDG